MEKVKAEEIKETLFEHGTVVTLEEASIILEFMRELIKLSIDQYIRKC